METRKRKITINVKIYNKFSMRLKGLMFRKKPLNEQEGILLSPCNSIHMFFMFFPIDAVFLDKHNRIVYIANQLQPGKWVKPVKEAHAVLEVQSGFAEKNGLKKNMKIIWGAKEIEVQEG